MSDNTRSLHVQGMDDDGHVISAIASTSSQSQTLKADMQADTMHLMKADPLKADYSVRYSVQSALNPHTVQTQADSQSVRNYSVQSALHPQSVQSAFPQAYSSTQLSHRSAGLLIDRVTTSQGVSYPQAVTIMAPGEHSRRLSDMGDMANMSFGGVHTQTVPPMGSQVHLSGVGDPYAHLVTPARPAGLFTDQYPLVGDYTEDWRHLITPDRLDQPPAVQRLATLPSFSPVGPGSPPGQKEPLILTDKAVKTSKQLLRRNKFKKEAKRLSQLLMAKKSKKLQTSENPQKPSIDLPQQQDTINISLGEEDMFDETPNRFSRFSSHVPLSNTNTNEMRSSTPVSHSATPPPSTSQVLTDFDQSTGLNPGGAAGQDDSMASHEIVSPDLIYQCPIDQFLGLDGVGRRQVADRYLTGLGHEPSRNLMLGMPLTMYFSMSRQGVSRLQSVWDTNPWVDVGGSTNLSSYPRRRSHSHCNLGSQSTASGVPSPSPSSRLFPLTGEAA